MAFVSEEIKEEDYEYFYSLNLKDDVGRPEEPFWWAIDRERNYILYDMGGGTLEKPVFMGLYLDGDFVEMWTTSRANVCWKIIEIYAPKELQEKFGENELFEIIKEAFWGYGLGAMRSSDDDMSKFDVDIQTEITWG